mgnify:CR=1 FL=1
MRACCCRGAASAGCVILVSVVAALAFGVHRRRPRTLSPAAPAAAAALSFDRVRELRAEVDRPRKRSRSSSSARAASRSPRVRREQPAARVARAPALRHPARRPDRRADARSAAAPAGPSSGSTAEARVAAKIAADEFGRPITLDRGRIARRTRENADPDDRRCSSPRGSTTSSSSPTATTCARALRAFSEAASGAIQIEPAPMGLAPAARGSRRSNGCPARDGFRDVRQLLRERVGQPRRRLTLSAHATAMAWRGSLALDYRRARRPHDRPRPPRRAAARAASALSRRRRSATACSVHPPGGIVGGDALAIAITLASGAHALITTPGDALLSQRRRDGVAIARASSPPPAAGSSGCRSRPIAYSGCAAEQPDALRARADGAEMIGWDVTALGLPASDQPIRRRPLHADDRAARSVARARQRSAPPTRACSTRRSAGPAERVLATMLVRRAGSARRRARRAALLEAAREAAEAHPLRATARRLRRTRPSSSCARSPAASSRRLDAAAARLAGMATARLAAAARRRRASGRPDEAQRVRVRDAPYDRIALAPLLRSLRCALRLRRHGPDAAREGQAPRSSPPRSSPSAGARVSSSTTRKRSR